MMMAQKLKYQCQSANLFYYVYIYQNASLEWRNWQRQYWESTFITAFEVIYVYVKVYLCYQE